MQNSEDNTKPAPQIATAQDFLYIPDWSTALVTAASMNETAESIPIIQRVNIKSPRVPEYPLSTAAAGMAIKIKPTELD